MCPSFFRRRSQQCASFSSPPREFVRTQCESSLDPRQGPPSVGPRSLSKLQRPKQTERRPRRRRPTPTVSLDRLWCPRYGRFLWSWSKSLIFKCLCRPNTLRHYVLWIWFFRENIFQSTPPSARYKRSARREVREGCTTSVTASGFWVNSGVLSYQMRRGAD